MSCAVLLAGLAADDSTHPDHSIVIAIGGVLLIASLYWAATTKAAVGRFPWLSHLPGAWKPPPSRERVVGRLRGESTLTVKGGSVRGHDTLADLDERSTAEFEGTEIEAAKRPEDESPDS